jgi:hypothetical protein
LAISRYSGCTCSEHFAGGHFALNLQPQSGRRTHPRTPIEISVVLIATAYGTTSIFSGRSYDLSEGGIRVVTSGRLRESQSVSLEFKIPDSPVPMKMYAQVKYNHQNVYGMQFVTPSENQLNQIRTVLMN